MGRNPITGKSYPKARNWCFTDNTCQTEPFFSNLKLYCRFVIMQKEKAPTTGELHWQGYVQLIAKQQITWLKNHISNVAHWEIAKGDPESNIAYCSKDDTAVQPPERFTHGTVVHERQRTDLETLKGAIRKGERLHSLIDEFSHLFAHNPKGMMLMFNTFHPIQEKINRVVQVYYGKTGTGKSHMARTNYPDAFIYPVQHSSMTWFDGYQGEKTVIFDEFSGQMSLEMMKKVIDCWRVSVPIKGGFVPWEPEMIIFTSQKPPYDWYNWEKHTDEDKQAFFRRITVVIEFRGNRVWKDVTEDYRPLEGDHTFHPDPIGPPHQRCFIDLREAHNDDHNPIVNWQDAWPTEKAVSPEEEIQLNQDDTQHEFDPPDSSPAQMPESQETLRWDDINHETGHFNTHDPLFDLYNT